MSDTRVIRTMLLLQELKTKALKGFVDFKDATSDDYHDCICYDSEHPLNSTSFGDIGGQPYPIVWGALIDEIHHDVISYYDTVIDGKVYAIVDPENGCSIAIEDLFPDEESIDLVFDGDDWYEV